MPVLLITYNKDQYLSLVPPQTSLPSKQQLSLSTITSANTHHAHSQSTADSFPVQKQLGIWKTILPTQPLSNFLVLRSEKSRGALEKMQLGLQPGAVQNFPVMFN